jgi:hypothetical protein
MTTFLHAALVRAGRTVAQTAVALIGTAVVVEAVDWQAVVSASVLAGILSLLTSAATSLPEVEQLPPPPPPSTSASSSSAAG